MTGTKHFAVAAVVILALRLAGAAQLRADAVQYVYQFGGNTFTWELPTNPVIAPGDAFPGTAFTIENLSFTENGVSITGTLDFFSTSSGGGFDLWNGYYFYFANAFGPQLYSGSEDAPTLLTGDFSLVDAGNTDFFLAGTTDLNVTTVPEPSAFALLAVGLAFGLAIFALRRN